MAKSLHAVIERASKSYIKQHAETYLERLNSVVTDWRKWVRQKLGVQKAGKRLNDSPFPRRRTGQLQNSLVTRRIQSVGLKKASNGRFQMGVRIPIYWKKLRGNGSGVSDYGEDLNSASRYSGTSFFGWKNRVHEELNARIKSRVSTRI